MHILAESIDYDSARRTPPSAAVPANTPLTTTEASSSWPSLPSELPVTNFVDLVQQRICEPANLEDTAYLRSDALPLPGSQCGAGNGRTIAWTAHDDECCLAIGH